ncbi:hypothetical protein AB0L75_14330 [Streptomyces sp. NPDC052101]|uniref:hypothetical protein n=1 Tax=Streptomyces sp. NPDC052101 TaxID=3155763 RepID=UPI0034256D8D
MAADDVRVAAVCEALAPLAWRSFTAESLCRRALAAMDRARPLDPGLEVREERLAVLVASLAGRRWRSWTLTGLSRRLVGAVRAWEEERMWFDIRLGWLLDEAG